MIPMTAWRPERKILCGNWQACVALSVGTDRAPDAAAWSDMPLPQLAAAVLREGGNWSLAGPPVRFDAQIWCYRLTFDAMNVTRGGRDRLGFDGLATAADVWLNGAKLLTSSSMFVAHQCEVGPLLKPAGNELLIWFKPLDEQLSGHKKRPRWRTPMVAHQQLRWHRTTLLGRTPGWSPPVPAVGPWRDVWLEQPRAVQVGQLDIRTSVERSTGVVHCTAELSGVEPGQVQSVWLELRKNGQIHSLQLTASGTSAMSFAGQLRIQEVELWWPHTHGEASLYEAGLRIRHGAQTDAAVDTVLQLGCLGFRSVSLQVAGGGFSLQINGVQVFCRGAVWMPLDMTSLRSSPQACRAAVAQACAAGMNMLRVAGTTVYEEDHFYAACDEAGMLVWQDFMFANMDYPADDPCFLSEVVLEVRQQVERLRTAACVAVLCGNSEVEQQAAMWGAQAQLWQPGLFTETLARLCADLAPGICYWPSSAHGGVFPHQANAGTTSYYGVGAYLRPLEDARRSELAFATECLAFANVPAPATLERMPAGANTRVQEAGWKERSPRDLGAGWDFDDVRDHYLGLIFNADARELRSVDHEHYLTLSRMVSGEVMVASFSEWRRPSSSCSGAMVLSMRDLWAGAGWGVVDDTGVPKACYHYLKRVLQPLAVLLSDEGVNGLFIHVINERPVDRTLQLELTAWRDGDVCVASGSKRFGLAGRSTVSFSAIDVLGYFMDLTHAYRFGPSACEAVAVALTDSEGLELAAAFFFPAGLSASRVPDIGLEVKASMKDEQTAELIVRTRQFAHGVHFDVPGYEAADEYFHLAPGRQATIRLRKTRAQALAGEVRAANSRKGARF